MNEYPELTDDQWIEQYKPIWSEEDAQPLSYSGTELEAERIEEHFVWTEVDGDEGVWIVAGYAFVNRTGNYYVTGKPWTDNCMPQVLWFDYAISERGETARREFRNK